MVDKNWSKDNKMQEEACDKMMKLAEMDDKDANKFMEYMDEMSCKYEGYGKKNEADDGYTSKLDKLNAEIRKLLDAGDDKSFEKAKKLQKEATAEMNKIIKITKFGEKEIDEASKLGKELAELKDADDDIEAVGAALDILGKFIKDTSMQKRGDEILRTGKIK